MDIIQNMILRQWEKAGGIYAAAAQLARIDMEKEERENLPSPAAHLTRADWDSIPEMQKRNLAGSRQVMTPEGWVAVGIREV